MRLKAFSLPLCFNSRLYFYFFKPRNIAAAALFLLPAFCLCQNANLQSDSVSNSTQAPTTVEPNRITGARMDVEYNEDRTSVKAYVTNISNKTIEVIRIAYKHGNSGGGGRSMSRANLKPGESTMEGLSGNGPITAYLDEIIYTDGSLETRNDTVAAELKEEEKTAKEQREREINYARGFAIPNPDIRMAQEEQIVRNYYAKLTLLSQIGVLTGVISRLSPAKGPETSKILESRIHFALSEFQVGDFSEIASSPWTRVLNPDAPRSVISVSGSGLNLGINEKKYFLAYYAVNWDKKISHADEQHERDRLTQAMRSLNVTTAGDAIKLDHPGNWSRYASYTVKATLDGRTITYRSVFLFADHGEKIAILDPAMRLPIELNAPLYPTALVETAYRELPLFKKWIVDNQLSGCKKFKEPEVCCDPVAGRCGLASEDVMHSLNVPVDDEEFSILKGLEEPVPVPASATKKANTASLD